ncbi:polymeric immunoglobulin receptor-like [Hoplias malabaricus]|uniref:polymeric immunoglobulin receptor-like n=1 Tax=Hoplias malabaricus TaxID=27720 RepID=UPI003461E715
MPNAKGLMDAAEVVGCLEGSVIIDCLYPPLFKAQPKAVCRIEQICQTRIRMNTTNRWVNADKFHVYYDDAASVLRVIILNLSLQDAGVYRCAAVQNSVYNPVVDWELKVDKDSSCNEPNTITAQLGQNFSFSRDYSENAKFNSKYVFKIHDHFVKQMASTSGTPLGLEEQMCRFSISDNEHNNTFIVSIKNVRLDDAGLYFCGVMTSELPVNYIRIIKNVRLLITAESMTSSEGDTVEVRCPYETKYRQSAKHICKDEEEEDECLNERRKLHPQPLRKLERVSVHDNITAGIFNIIITGVTAEDAGKYWCGVKTGEMLMYYLSTRLQVITKEVLHVIGHESHSVSIECRYRRAFTKMKGNFFCKGQTIFSCFKYGVKISAEKSRNGRFSLSDGVSDGLFTVTITDLRAEDSGTYWCVEESIGSLVYTKVNLQVMKAGSSVVGVTLYICVILLLTGGLILIVCKLKCNKTQEVTAPSHFSSMTQLKDNTSVLSVTRNYKGSDPPAVETQTTVINPTYTSVSFRRNKITDDEIDFIKESSDTEYAIVRCYKPQLNSNQ